MRSERLPKLTVTVILISLFTVKQNGVEKEFRLVSFADAGQNKEEYTVLHEGIESPESEPEVLFEK